MQEPLQTRSSIASRAEAGSRARRAPQDWKSAPLIVKIAAFFSLLALAVSLVFSGIMIVALTSGSGTKDTGSEFLILTLYLVTFALNCWLRFALEKGASAAWIVQIIFSCLALLNFPIGTIIHGIILSQWFKPETKVWFGVQ